MKIKYVSPFIHCSTGSSWLKVVPWGMRRLITFVKNNYGNPPIYVTENGVSDKSGTLKDDDRTNYFRNYTNEMLKGLWKLKSKNYFSKIPSPALDIRMKNFY